MTMFLMIGITDGRKDFEYSQVTECELCGRYSRMRVFMTYTALLLFFIPCLKWNKKYFVQMDCCGGIMQLSDEVGQRIARGEQVQIRKEDLHRTNSWRRGKTCPNCGYSTAEDFDFCPKCGTRL